MILQHVEELLQYLKFGLWWVALGVASSIGLGEQIYILVLVIAFFCLFLCVWNAMWSITFNSYPKMSSTDFYIG